MLPMLLLLSLLNDGVSSDGAIILILVHRRLIRFIDSKAGFRESSFSCNRRQIQFCTA
jgi:hypothetical protein